MKKIKVLIVDDSALIRQILTEILSADDGIDVVGTASNPLIARDKIKQLNPDVLTLDVEMPKMDGMTFLANVMRLRPMPVVMISSLTAKGADITLQALELGAVDFMLKPKIDALRSMDEYGELITLKVKTASKANVRRQTVAPVQQRSEPGSQGAPVLRHFKVTNKIIAIGASTGGTEAIQAVLLGLPVDLPGIVITQHIPEQFSERFAIRMNNCCALTVSEARHGDHILPGHVYIAPGDQHLLIERSGTKYVCLLNGDLPVNRHRPSVDVLFHSVAKHARSNAVGVILTGMGNDGAVGLKAMKDAGATTVAQDENTSVVWGMPGEAVKLGAAEEIVALEQVAGTIRKLVMRK